MLMMTRCGVAMAAALMLTACSTAPGGGGSRGAAPVQDGSKVGAVDENFRRAGRQPTGSIFEALDLPTPNDQRLGSGAPGPGYWQQRADYTIDAELDAENRSVSARVQIEYYNNSPHDLDYIWMQLEQNLFRSDSIGTLQRTPGSVMKMLEAEFDGGYTIRNLRSEGVAGQELMISVYDTLARVELPRAIPAGSRFVFSFDFEFSIPPHLRRMGSEDVEQGRIFELAQWFPHICNYDDVNGWNTSPYLGSGEFYTNFGSYDVRLTVPATHIVSATGVLQNPGEVLTGSQIARLEEALASDEPVRIVSAAEVGTRGVRPRVDGTMTWHFQADDVRTFAWASSDAFIWDAVGAGVTDLDGTRRRVMVQSLYPKEAIVWDMDHEEGGATRAGKHSIEFYSEFLWPYPYLIMSNINGPEGGMEYPMIIFCGSRENVRGMVGVTDHEIGHAWFPMIVNSDERRYMWQDEGFNTFINIYSIAAYNDEEVNVERHLNQAMEIAAAAHSQPIMTHPDRHWSRWVGGLNYRKTGLGLYLLREKILGKERFDAAFGDYVRRWAFKHPQPSDFFRTMEDAAGAELSWFWRGWFLESAQLDQAVVGVNNRGADAIVVLDNRGRMVMPVFLRIGYSDGTTEDVDLPVEIWSTTDRWQARIDTGGRAIRSVEIDADGYLPDMNRSNNRWR
jgi:hypothetical protein